MLLPEDDAGMEDGSFAPSDMISAEEVLEVAATSDAVDPERDWGQLGKLVGSHFKDRPRIGAGAVWAMRPLSGEGQRLPGEGGVVAEATSTGFSGDEVEWVA